MIGIVSGRRRFILPGRRKQGYLRLFPHRNIPAVVACRGSLQEQSVPGPVDRGERERDG